MFSVKLDAKLFFVGLVFWLNKGACSWFCFYRHVSLSIYKVVLILWEIIYSHLVALNDALKEEIQHLKILTGQAMPPNGGPMMNFNSFGGGQQFYPNNHCITSMLNFFCSDWFSLSTFGLMKKWHLMIVGSNAWKIVHVQLMQA